jgi:hypothetical protein
MNQIDRLYDLTALWWCMYQACFNEMKRV